MMIASRAAFRELRVRRVGRPLAAVLVALAVTSRAVTVPAAEELRFDVAAVKANRSDDPPASRFPLGIGDAFTGGGLFAATNQPLVVYLRFAFKRADIDGLPGWVSAERFDIEARASGMPSKDDMRLMMQALLRERFALEAHTERRTGDGLALITVKRGVAGPNLRRADPRNCDATARSGDLIPCGRIGPSTASTPGRLRISGRSIPLSRLATFLTNPATGIVQPVFDRTALTGLFDMDVEWTADEDTLSDLSRAEAGALTLAQALHDQLGLKLTHARGPVEVLRVLRIARPTSD